MQRTQAATGKAAVMIGGTTPFWERLLLGVVWVVVVPLALVTLNAWCEAVDFWWHERRRRR